MRNLRCFSCLICFLLVFFVGGCAIAFPPTEVIATQTIEPRHPTLTATNAVGPPTKTDTPFPLPETPLPTLSPDDAYARMQDLLKSNDSCRLPCWWGITAGKTSWQDASRFLETFTYVNQKEISNNNSISGYAYVYLPLPPDQGTLNHTYVIEDNTVIEIYAYVFDWSPFLFLSDFLAEYGPPDEGFLRTFRYDENGSQPYQIDLFYAKLGMLLEYSGGDPNTAGEKIQNCFDDMYSPFVYIWSSDTPMTSAEAIDKFLDTQNMPYPIPLDKATGMNIISFYETFKNPDNTICLETPLKLWP